MAPSCRLSHPVCLRFAIWYPIFPAFLIIILIIMTVMVPPGMIVVVTRPIVVIAVAVVIGMAVVTRIIVGIVSRSEGKAETATCLRGLRSDGRKTESGEANRKEFFHVVMWLYKRNLFAEV